MSNPGDRYLACLGYGENRPEARAHLDDPACCVCDIVPKALRPKAARRRDGVERAKTAGVYRGRPRTLDAEAVRERHAEGLGVIAIARALNMSRTSVYRLLKAKEKAAGDPLVNDCAS